jgi:hypothetical protein
MLGTWRLVIWYIYSNMAEESFPSIFMVNSKKTREIFPTKPIWDLGPGKVPNVKGHDYCHGWRAERRRTWTCGGVPRTYTTASAISSGFRCGFFSSHSSGTISVHTVPGLILWNVKYWGFDMKIDLIKYSYSCTGWYKTYFAVTVMCNLILLASRSYLLTSLNVHTLYLMLTLSQNFGP